MIDTSDKLNRHPVSFKTPTTPEIGELPPCAELFPELEEKLHGITLDRSERTAVFTTRKHKQTKQ